jgi:hypothetical protein
LPTVGEPRLIHQHVQASLGQVGHGLQLGIITPSQHDEVAMPIRNQALQELRAFMQMQAPVGRMSRSRIKTLDQRHKGLALRARRRIHMDVRGEPRIGRAERQGSMKMPGFIEHSMGQRHGFSSMRGDKRFVAIRDTLPAPEQLHDLVQHLASLLTPCFRSDTVAIRLA